MDKKNKFKRIKKMMSSGGKATSELKASKNPKKFMEENIEPSLKGKKGIAG